MSDAKPGEMHSIDQAFYDLTVKQRNAAWREVATLRSQVVRYEEHLDAHCPYGEDECAVLRDYLTPTVDAPPDCTHDQCAGCRNHQAEGGKGCCGDPSCPGPLTTVVSGE